MIVQMQLREIVRLALVRRSPEYARQAELAIMLHVDRRDVLDAVEAFAGDLFPNCRDDFVALLSGSVE